jgi:hypothetical protein
LTDQLLMFVGFDQALLAQALLACGAVAALPDETNAVSATATTKESASALRML